MCFCPLGVFRGGVWQEMFCCWRSSLHNLWWEAIWLHGSVLLHHGAAHGLWNRGRKHTLQWSYQSGLKNLCLGKFTITMCRSSWTGSTRSLILQHVPNPSQLNLMGTFWNWSKEWRLFMMEKRSLVYQNYSLMEYQSKWPLHFGLQVVLLSILKRRFLFSDD